MRRTKLGDLGAKRQQQLRARLPIFRELASEFQRCVSTSVPINVRAAESWTSRARSPVVYWYILGQTAPSQAFGLSYTSILLSKSVATQTRESVQKSGFVSHKSTDSYSNTKIHQNKSAHKTLSIVLVISIRWSAQMGHRFLDQERQAELEHR